MYQRAEKNRCHLRALKSSTVVLRYYIIWTLRAVRRSLLTCYYNVIFFFLFLLDMEKSFHFLFLYIRRKIANIVLQCYICTMSWKKYNSSWMLRWKTILFLKCTVYREASFCKVVWDNILLIKYILFIMPIITALFRRQLISLAHLIIFSYYDETCDDPLDEFFSAILFNIDLRYFYFILI